MTDGIAMAARAADGPADLSSRCGPTDPVCLCGGAVTQVGHLDLDRHGRSRSTLAERVPRGEGALPRAPTPRTPEVMRLSNQQEGKMGVMG